MRRYALRMVFLVVGLAAFAATYWAGNTRGFERGYNQGYADAARKEFSAATLEADKACGFLTTENRAWHCAAAGYEGRNMYGCKDVYDSMSDSKKADIINHAKGLPGAP